MGTRSTPEPRERVYVAVMIGVALSAAVLVPAQMGAVGGRTAWERAAVVASAAWMLVFAACAARLGGGMVALACGFAVAFFGVAQILIIAFW